MAGRGSGRSGSGARSPGKARDAGSGDLQASGVAARPCSSFPRADCITATPPPAPGRGLGSLGSRHRRAPTLGLHGSRGSSGRAGPFLLGRAPALEPQLRVTELSGSRGVPAGGRASRRGCDRGPSARLGGGAGRTGGGVARRTQAEAPREPGGPGQAQGRRAVRPGAASGGTGRFAAAGHGHARAPRTPHTAERAGRGSAASEYLWIPLF